MRATRLHKALVVACALALAAPVATLPAFAPAAGGETLPSFSGMVKKSVPAVVTVRVEATPDTVEKMPGMPDDPQLREFFERFFGGQGQPPMPGIPGPPGGGGAPPMMGLGSGFIIDKSGLIVTNNHVVQQADTVTVIRNNGEELQAKVVGRDEKTDIAVLRVNADEDLPTVPWGDSDKVEVGDWVIAIGNPFGFGGSVSAGIISARGRNLQAGPYDDFIQFDAPINQGNSGGPLFDQQGNVIGVNAAIFSPSGGNVGVGFAIPSNLAREIATELAKNGSIERGWLGVSIQPVTEEIAESLGLQKAEGALVASLMQNGPAAKAGLRAGDVIQRFQDTEIKELRDLTTAVADTDPGSSAELTVWRGGSEETISVDIVKMPEEEQAALTPPPQEEPEAQLGELGLSARPGEAGLLVTDVAPQSDAAAKGIQAGDTILAANQEPVKTVEALNEVVRVAREQNRKSVLLLVSRNGDQRFVTVELGTA